MLVIMLRVLVSRFLSNLIFVFRTVNVKDTKSGKVKVIYDAKEVISGLKAPIVKDAEVTNKEYLSSIGISFVVLIKWHVNFIGYELRFCCSLGCLAN